MLICNISLFSLTRSKKRKKERNRVVNVSFTAGLQQALGLGLVALKQVINCSVKQVIKIILKPLLQMKRNC